MYENLRTSFFMSVSDFETESFFMKFQTSS